jgi:F-type H+-transporting ATPase subunit alpha
MPLHQQVEVLYAVVNGYLDDVEVNRARDFEAAFNKFMTSNHPEIGRSIDEKLQIVPETEEVLKASIQEFKQNVPY